MTEAHSPEHQPQAEANDTETKNKPQVEIDESLDINNQPGFLERVRNNTKEFVSSVKTTARIGTVERLQTWWNDSSYKRQDQKAGKFSSQHNDHDREVHALEDRIRRQDIADADMEHRFGSSQERSRKSQKDRETLMHRMEQVKNEREIARLNLESVNYKKQVYEKKVKGIASGVVERVNERLEPQEASLEVMRARKQQLDSEILTFQSNVDETENILDQMERVQARAGFDFDKDAYGEQIREIRLQLKDYQKNLDQRTKEAKRLGSSIESVTGKVVSWRAKRMQYEKVLNREYKYAHHDADQEDMAAVRARMDAFSREDREKQKKPNKLDPEVMRKLWNGVLGNKLRITAKQLEMFVNPKIKVEGVNYLTFKYIVQEITGKKISESDWNIFESEVQKQLRSGSQEEETQEQTATPSQLVPGTPPEAIAEGVTIEPSDGMPGEEAPQAQAPEETVEAAIEPAGSIESEVGEGSAPEEGEEAAETEVIEKKVRKFGYNGFDIKHLVTAWNQRFSEKFQLDLKTFSEDADSMFPDRKNKHVLKLRDFKKIIENQFAHLTDESLGSKPEEVAQFKEDVQKFKEFFIENQIGKMDGYVDEESDEFYAQEADITSLCELWNDLSDDADDISPEKLQEHDPDISSEGNTTLSTARFMDDTEQYRRTQGPKFDNRKSKKTAGWFSRLLIRRWGLKKKK